MMKKFILLLLLLVSLTEAQIILRDMRGIFVSTSGISDAAITWSKFSDAVQDSIMTAYLVRLAIKDTTTKYVETITQSGGNITVTRVGRTATLSLTGSSLDSTDMAASGIGSSIIVDGQIKTVDLANLGVTWGKLSTQTQDSIAHSYGWSNVKSYGVVGNGTDETTKIKTAIRTGGKIIYFPAGTYGVKYSIQVRKNKTLLAFGKAAKIVQLESAATKTGKSGSMFVCVEDSIEFNGLTLRGFGQLDYTYGYDAFDGHPAVAQNYGQHGITALGYQNTIKVTNCNISNFGGVGILLIERSIITNNKIDSCGNEGIYCHLSNNRVENNTVTNCMCNGIDFPAHDNICTGNRVHHCGWKADSITVFGVKKPNGTWPADIAGIMPVDRGIDGEWNHTTLNGTGTIVSHNVIDSCGSAGIYGGSFKHKHATAPSHGMIIEGNIIHDCNLEYFSPYGHSAGIYYVSIDTTETADATTTHTRIINNTVYNDKGNGITLLGGQHQLIAYNTLFRNDGEGIRFGQASDSLKVKFNNISNNMIFQNGSYGVNLLGWSAWSPYHNIISNNIISDNGASAIFSTWAPDNLIQGNIINDSNTYAVNARTELADSLAVTKGIRNEGTTLLKDDLSIKDGKDLTIGTVTWNVAATNYINGNYIASYTVDSTKIPSEAIRWGHFNQAIKDTFNLRMYKVNFLDSLQANDDDYMLSAAFDDSLTANNVLAATDSLSGALLRHNSEPSLHEITAQTVHTSTISSATSGDIYISATGNDIWVDGGTNLQLGRSGVDGGDIRLRKDAQTGAPYVLLSLSDNANGDFSITASKGDVILAPKDTTGDLFVRNLKWTIVNKDSLNGAVIGIGTIPRSRVTNLSDSLAAKLDKSSFDDSTNAIVWSGDLGGTGKSPSVADNSHDHTIGNVTSLQDSLNVRMQKKNFRDSLAVAHVDNDLIIGNEVTNVTDAGWSELVPTGNCNSITGWTAYGGGTVVREEGGANSTTYCATNSGTGVNTIGITTPAFSLVAGNIYTLSFWAKLTGTYNYTYQMYRIETPGGTLIQSDNGIGSPGVTGDWVLRTLNFTALYTTSTSTFVFVVFSAGAGDNYKIYLDEVSLKRTGTTLTRSGSGTAVAPYTLGINLAANNAWTGTGPTTFAGNLSSTNTAVTVTADANTFAIASNGVTVTGAETDTVDTITGGTAGQILVLLFVDTNLTITDTDATTANTVDLSAAFVSAADKTLMLWNNGNKWFELTRSTN